MNDNERMEIENRMYFDNVGAMWGAFTYRYDGQNSSYYPDNEGRLSDVYKWAESTLNEDSSIMYILISPYFGSAFERDSPMTHCAIGAGCPDVLAERLKRDFIVYVHVTDAPHFVGVLPFDDTPLPLSIEQQIDAAIAKHALTVESDCDDDDEDDDDDYYASADYLEEMESEIEAWRDFAVKLTNAPRCMVETPYEAQSWLELKGLIR